MCVDPSLCLAPGLGPNRSPNLESRLAGGGRSTHDFPPARRGVMHFRRVGSSDSRPHRWAVTAGELESLVWNWDESASAMTANLGLQTTGLTPSPPSPTAQVARLYGERRRPHQLAGRALPIHFRVIAMHRLGRIPCTTPAEHGSRMCPIPRTCHAVCHASRRRQPLWPLWTRSEPASDLT